MTTDGRGFLLALPHGSRLPNPPATMYGGALSQGD